MSTIEYVAKRPKYPGHVENEVYSIELDVMSAVPDVTDTKETARSPGGAFEANLLRTVVTWRISFAPVRDLEAVLLEELLESIESGETWKIWLGEAAMPLILKCGEDVYSRTSFQRNGGEDEDYWTGAVSAYQASAYDPTGALPPSSAGGGGGTAGGETTEIYDPAIGGEDGGLDPPLDPPPEPLQPFSLTITPGLEKWIDGTTRAIGIPGNNLQPGESLGTLDSCTNPELDFGLVASSTNDNNGDDGIEYFRFQIFMTETGDGNDFPGDCTTITVPGVGSFAIADAMGSPEGGPPIIDLSSWHGQWPTTASLTTGVQVTIDVT